MLRILAAAIFCAALIGCSSSSDSDNESADGQSDATILKGIFVDSPVEGLTYFTPTQSGETNALGEFDYLEGETVTFSIGDVVFPGVLGAPQISPVSIASGSSNPTDTTTNIARLLQSLDADGNPDNGITISAAASANSSAINFDVSLDEFENDTNVINLVANSGSVNSSLISSAAANQHLNDTLGLNGMAESAPNYRNEIRDGEGEAFIADDVINLVGSSSDGSRQRNRLIVDTENRLIWDLTVTEANPGDSGTVKVVSFVALYNDTVDTSVTEPQNSAGNVSVDVGLTLFSGETEMTMSICTSRDTGDDSPGVSVFPKFEGENCIYDSTPVQIGERIRFGTEFDLESGVFRVTRNDTVMSFQSTASQIFRPVFPFNRLEVRAEDGPGRIVTKIHGIGSDGFDDDFSNGVVVDGINN